jgi:phage-related protein
MREENVKFFVQGYYDGETEFFELAGNRMLKIILKDDDGMRRFTKHLKEMRDLMDIDLENHCVTIDRDNFESIMFTAVIASRGAELFGGLKQ